MHWINQLVEWVRWLLPIFSFLVTFATWVIARRLARKQRKLQELAEKPIIIRLISPAAKTVDLPYQPRRSQLTRAELLGVLGMFATGGRFAISSLPSVFIDGQYEAVLKGITNILSINVSDQEMLVFDNQRK